MRRSITRMRNISRNNRHKRSPSPSCAEGAGLLREAGGWAVISSHLQFPHSLYVRVKGIVERVGYFSGAIRIGDAADGILQGKAGLKAQHAFDLVRIDVVGAVVVSGRVFQLDGLIAQRGTH